MRNTLILGLMLAAVALPQTNDGWKLVWSDEFNEEGRPNPALWTYENGFTRNRELQWYQPDNARVENGLLIIEGKREQLKNPNFEAGSPDWKKNREYAQYTSSSLTTRRMHSWQYGRFEMRGRIDIRAGIWPAWWTLGVEKRWPANGEVDIMEYYKGVLLANLIWAGPKGTQSVTTRKPVTSFEDPDWAEKFHVWRLDWDENRMVISVDDLVLNDTDLNKTLNPDGTNPYRQPEYMILNLAIGGDAGGDPSATEFPSRFEVDWVRVYQRE